jgi:hypothetical protein
VNQKFKTKKVLAAQFIYVCKKEKNKTTKLKKILLLIIVDFIAKCRAISINAKVKCLCAKQQNIKIDCIGNLMLL